MIRFNWREAARESLLVIMITRVKKMPIWRIHSLLSQTRSFLVIFSVEKGPKGTKMVNLNVFDHLGPILGPSGPFWTILDKNDFFAPNGQSRGWQRCFGAKYQFLFETVQKGPDGPKRVPNGQKHLGWPFWSLSDPFGPLWSVDKPAMFGPFWSKMDHF